jgi:hypothetical protein
LVPGLPVCDWAPLTTALVLGPAAGINPAQPLSANMLMPAASLVVLYLCIGLPVLLKVWPQNAGMRIKLRKITGRGVVFFVNKKEPKNFVNLDRACETSVV